MSNPVAPGAGSLEALIQKWQSFAAGKVTSGDDYYDGQRCGVAKCAKELEALLASTGRPLGEPRDEEQPEEKNQP